MTRLAVLVLGVLAVSLAGCATMRRFLPLGPLVTLLAASGLLLLSPVPGTAGGASCIGRDYSAKDEGSLTCRLGLELWEESKRSTTIFQQWNLTCSLRSRLSDAFCDLERTQVVTWPEHMGGAQVSTHRHSTWDKTLRLLEADLKQGRLELEIIYPRGERMPVLIRLKPLGGSVFTVDSFQAKDVVRTTFTDEIVSQEWRIPEYTYSLTAPLVILGKKSAGDKAVDNLLRRLSASDRTVWESSMSRCLDSDAAFKQEPIKSLMAHYEKKMNELDAKIQKAKEADKVPLVAERDAAWKELFGRDELKSAFWGALETCLRGARMSPGGLQLIREYFLTNLLPTLSR